MSRQHGAHRATSTTARLATSHIPTAVTEVASMACTHRGRGGGGYPRGPLATGSEDRAGGKRERRESVLFQIILNLYIFIMYHNLSPPPRVQYVFHMYS